MDDDREIPKTNEPESMDWRSRARNRRDSDDDYRDRCRLAKKPSVPPTDRDDANDADDPQQSRSLPAKPSDHGILSFADLIASGEVQEVYIYGRESTRKQDLKSMLKGSRKQITKQGVKVVHAFGDKGKDGKSLDPAERAALFRALDAARMRGIPLVAPAFSRFLRAADYDAVYAPKVRPSVEELEAFLELTKGVTLAVLTDPDADPAQDETFLRAMKAKVKRRQVGRPSENKMERKRRKKDWFDWARARRKEGMTYEEIADAMFEHGVPTTAKTIWAWTHDVEVDPK